MKAMIVNQWGEPRDMTLVDLPDPRPAAGQVTLDVEAIGCNFFDILMVQGKYQVRPPFPFSPGNEVAGVIREVGPGANRFAIGDRVLAMPGWGGFASVVVAPESGVHQVPAAMSFEHAAAFPIVYQTSYFGLVHRANLQPGETLLVHAAAGGVGLAAVQIGSALGARVLAAAGSARKLAIAREQGATETIDYSTPGWEKQVLELTAGRGADVIYDPVGGDIFDLSTKCIAFEGRLVVVGFTSGRIPAIQANRILLKNISIVGLHWGTYRDREPALIDRTFATLFDLYHTGGIHPLVSVTYPLSNAAAALEEIGSRRSIGKVVLRP
jgi:NADPH2:quinone reductase